MQGNLTLSWNGSGWLTELLNKREWGKAVGSVRALAQARGIQPALRAVISQGLVSHLPDGLWLTAHRLRGQKIGGPDSWQSQSPINPVFAAAQRETDRSAGFVGKLEARHQQLAGMALVVAGVVLVSRRGSAA